MKTFTSIPAIALTALLIAGPATAISITDINTVGIDTASVMLSVDGDVATLTGNVYGNYEKDALERAAMDLEGVEEVRNFLSY